MDVSDADSPVVDRAGRQLVAGTPVVGGFRATITQCFRRPLAHAPQAVGDDGAPARPALRARGVLPAEGDVVGGHYRLVERLGEGAFGRVYAAERVDVPEHRVALKVTARAALAGRNVERELVMLAAAGHPNVIQLKDHGVCDGYVWFTMPLLAGETLAERLERGPLGLREAHDIFVPIARGLEALHAAGLRHQDIKPDNVYLARFAGRVHPVILDLGVAVEHDAVFVAGTILYGAPEQVVALLGTPGALPLGEKMDVYCLGATLLASLVGPANFPGEDASSRDELARAFEERQEAPLRPAALPALRGMPRVRLAAALRRFLRHEAAARPSAGEVAAELDVLLADEREREAAAHRVFERQRTALGRMRFAAVALVLAGIGVAAYAYSKRETWRLAGELERARAEGARSFDQLDTCTAAHALAAGQVESCTAERDAAAASHERSLAALAGTQEAAVAAADRRATDALAKWHTCSERAERAEETLETERARLERVAGEARDAAASRERALERERDEARRELEQALADRAESERRASACRSEQADCAVARDDCRHAAELARAALAAPSPLAAANVLAADTSTPPNSSPGPTGSPAAPSP